MININYSKIVSLEERNSSADEFSLLWEDEYLSKGLTPDKKKLFKSLIGSASNEKIDMSMVRDDYKNNG